MLPIIKWAGGKRRFANQITAIIGNDYKCYYEPFIGGGAILLHMMPKKAVCSDINEELINFYNVVKNSPEELIKEMDKYVNENNKEFYLNIREYDRNGMIEQMNSVQRAGRFLYLNKTCYNGLWRVNNKGEFNVPYGKYVNPKFFDVNELNEASKYFKNVEFNVCDYKKTAMKAKKGDFVYFDPPYDVEEGQNSFVSYTKSGFNQDNQRQLKELCDTLIRRGVTVGISNSNTKFIKDLYCSDDYISYELHEDIIVNRTIGGTPSSRRQVTELFILGRKR